MQDTDRCDNDWSKLVLMLRLATTLRRLCQHDESNDSQASGVECWRYLSFAVGEIKRTIADGISCGVTTHNPCE